MGSRVCCRANTMSNKATAYCLGSSAKPSLGQARGGEKSFPELKNWQTS